MVEREKRRRSVFGKFKKNLNLKYPILILGSSHAVEWTKIYQSSEMTVANLKFLCYFWPFTHHVTLWLNPVSTQVQHSIEIYF